MMTSHNKNHHDIFTELFCQTFVAKTMPRLMVTVRWHRAKRRRYRLSGLRDCQNKCLQQNNIMPLKGGPWRQRRMCKQTGWRRRWRWRWVRWRWLPWWGESLWIRRELLSHSDTNTDQNTEQPLRLQTKTILIHQMLSTQRWNQN